MKNKPQNDDNRTLMARILRIYADLISLSALIRSTSVNPRSIFCVVLVCGSFLFLSGCSTYVEEVAGGTSDSGNPRISGTVTDSRGDVVAGAEVFLFSTDYNPVNRKDDSQFSRSVQTDENGDYLLKNIPDGDYNLIARDAGDGSGALLRGVNISEDEQEISSLDLNLAGTGMISISLVERSVKEGDYFYIPGTDMYTQVTAPSLSKKSADIRSVPPGTYPDILHAQTVSSSGENIIAEDFSLEPEETAVVGPYSQWKHKTKVGINTSRTGANVTDGVHDFPLLVRLSSDYVTLSLSKGDGADLRFTKSDGVTPLPYEIERWDQVNGTAEVWIRLDTVYGDNSTQFIFMYMGLADAPAQSSGPAVFDTAAGFTAIWHLVEDEPGTGGTSVYRDATANGNHGDDFIGGGARPGVIGRGQDFNGLDDRVEIPEGNNLPTESITVSAWIRLNRYKDWNDIFVKHEWHASPGSWALNIDSAGMMRFGVSDSSQHVGMVADIPLDEWIHVAGTYDGYRVRAWLNGVPGPVSSTVTIPLRTQDWLRLSGYSQLDGSMDEARISRTARSAEWLKLCYENQKPGSGMVEIE
jgi:hypothetical protein